MGLTSNTGLLSSAPQKPIAAARKTTKELKCSAPFVLRPWIQKDRDPPPLTHTSRGISMSPLKGVLSKP
ncbi:unnamed protein product, partial [Iphiclides podalirius]